MHGVLWDWVKATEYFLFPYNSSQEKKKKKEKFSNNTVHSTTKESILLQLAQKRINALSAMTGEQGYLCLV